MKQGLRKQSFLKRHDPRKFSYKKKFGSVNLAILPKDGTGRLPTKIKDQKLLDFCIGFAGASVREDTEKVNLSPFLTWAYAAYLRKDYKSWGMDMGNLAKSAIKCGFIEEEEANYTSDMDRNFLAQLKNYPSELIEKAKKHKAKSYFWIDGDYSFFDNIRVALYQHNSENLTILTGCDFKMSWLNEPKGIIKAYNKKEKSFGHALKLYDFCEINGEQYIKAQLSNGTIGDNGTMYFHKDIVNSPVFGYGAIMFIDEDLDSVKQEQWSLIAKILDALEKVLKLMFQQTEIIKEEIIKEEPKYLWDTPENARHSVRVICDEEGLSWDMKNKLCETINCESDFDPKAIHINSNGTKDCGIAQFNEAYYLAENNMTCQEAIDNPEKSVRIMIEAFKKGRQSDWICYRKLYG